MFEKQNDGISNNNINPDNVENDTNFSIKNIINSSISSITTQITTRGKSIIEYYSYGNQLLMMCKIYIGLLIISELKYIIN